MRDYLGLSESYWDSLSQRDRDLYALVVRRRTTGTR
jgi:hypothetical protein